MYACSKICSPPPQSYGGLSRRKGDYLSCIVLVLSTRLLSCSTVLAHTVPYLPQLAWDPRYSRIRFRKHGRTGTFTRYSHSPTAPSEAPCLFGRSCQRKRLDVAHDYRHRTCLLRYESACHVSQGRAVRRAARLPRAPPFFGARTRGLYRTHVGS